MDAEVDTDTVFCARVVADAHGAGGLAVITDEFELSTDPDGIDRTDDGRLVARELSGSEQGHFGSIRQTGDWEAERILPHEVLAVEGFSIERYWREAVTLILALLIIVSLLLAFVTRNQSGGDGGLGGDERIESIDTIPSAIQPRPQGVFDDPDVAGGGENDSTETTDTPDDRSDLLPDSGEPESTSATTAATSATTAAPSSTVTPPTAPSTSAPATTKVPATTQTTEAPTTTQAPTTTTTEPTTTTTVTTRPPQTIAPPIEVSLVNGGFDAANISPGGYVIVGSIPGWVSQTGDFEIWHSDKADVGAVDGTYLLELNANGQGLIYQDFATTPGSTITWRFSHRGREGRESMELLLGSTNDSLESVRIVTTGTRWNRYNGSYVVPQGQTTTRLVFKSLESGGAANLLDAVRVNLRN